MTSFNMTKTSEPVSTANKPARQKLNGLVLAALTLVLVGCTAPRPGADLPPFGDSVRHTKAIQTYEPGDTVPPLQGATAVEVMRTYRLPPIGGGQAPSSTQ